MILGTTKEPKSSEAASCPIGYRSWILGVTPRPGVICWLPLLLQQQGLLCLLFILSLYAFYCEWEITGKDSTKFPLDISRVPDSFLPVISAY